MHGNELSTQVGTVDERLQIAKVFTEGGYFPDIKSVAQCATKLIVGHGMGLDPYDSMSGLHVIQGKVVLAANLMAAAIKRNPKYDYRAKTTSKSSTITFYDVTGEKPSKLGETSFTMEDAKTAGLGGTNWKKYPKAMLFARAISAGYREHCPDALGAGPVYVEAHGETELGVSIDQHNEEIQDTMVASGSGAAPALPRAHKPSPAPAKEPAVEEVVEMVEAAGLDVIDVEVEPAGEQVKVGSDGKEFYGDPSDKSCLRGYGHFKVTQAAESNRGTNQNGREWVAYQISCACGTIFSTYEEEHVEEANIARQADGDVEIKWTRNNKGYCQIHAEWAKRPEVNGVGAGAHDCIRVTASLADQMSAAMQIQEEANAIS